MFVDHVSVSGCRIAYDNYIVNPQYCKNQSKVDSWKSKGENPLASSKSLKLAEKAAFCIVPAGVGIENPGPNVQREWSVTDVL